MRRVYILIVFLPFGFSHCKNSAGKLPIQHDINSDSASDHLHIIADTIDHKAYPEIYSFLSTLIKNHDIDTSFGLILEPEAACDLSQTDIIYLKKNLLLEKKNKKNSFVSKSDTTNAADTMLNISIKLPPIIYVPSFSDQCLTYSDINFMVRNKPDPIIFRWDNFRLGFNLNNRMKYYNLSIPMFSLDHKIAVILIEELCPGLCGSGMTYVYRKTGKKWIHSNIGVFWVH